MSGTYQQATARRGSLHWAVVAGVMAALFAILVFGGEKVVLLLNGLCVAVVIFFIALRIPWLMVVLWTLSTQIMVEMVIWDYSNYVEPSLNIGGGIDMLYGDPILFGIIGAMVYRLIAGDPRAKNTFFKESSMWTVFMIWMLFELARSVMMFGLVSPLGEFRTYFREILVVPYIVIFARNRQQQWVLFKALLFTSLSFIAIGIFRGAVVHKFAFAAYAKWLYQHGSLALLWGAIGLFMMQKYGFWRHGSFKYGLIMAISMGLTVIASHRSVWLAAMVVIGVLFLTGHLSAGNIMKLGMGMLAAALVIDVVYDEIDLIAFVSDRLVALTSPTEDETANWRYLIWLDALEQAQAHLFEGKGLGNYFQMRAPNGAIVTTMLHNQYIQLLYQIGVVGLALYGALIFQITRRLRRTYKETMDPFYRMTAHLAFVVLIGASAYYVAYDFEPFTWLFVGLGLSVAQSHSEGKEATRRYLRAMHAYQQMMERKGVY